jgi:hypothetical protein
MKWGRLILVVVLVAIVIALVVGVIYLYPFWRLPPVDRSVLEARVTQYRAIADEVRNRPKDDREQYLALVQELKPVIDAESKKSGKNSLMGINFKSECPSYNREEVLQAKDAIAKVTAGDERLRAIFSGGFAPWEEMTLEMDLLNFSDTRRLVYAHMAAAVWEMEMGRAKESADAILGIMPLPDGLLKTPVLIYAMVGIAVNDIIDRTTIALLPGMPDAEVTRLREEIAKRPDAIEETIRSLKTEVVGMSDVLARTPSQVRASMGKNSQGWYMPLLASGGYLARERLKYIHFAGEVLDKYDEWHKNGAKEKTDIREIVHNAMKTSYFIRISWPNTDKLLEKGVMARTHREAMITALDLELQRRQSGGKMQIQLPYDDENVITLEKEKGCIAKKAIAKTEEAGK